jgi:N-acetylneuraminic acid mutarotase
MKKTEIVIAVALLVGLAQQASVADTWTSRASMGATRRFPGVAVVGGKLYAIGGDGTRVTEEFDPVANSWTVMDSMPTTRWWGFGTGAVNGKIYAIGGAAGGVYLDENEEFDPSADSWASRTAMPTERHGLAVGVINDTIYAIGGRNSSGYLAVNEAYDPATDTWTTKTPMPTARYYLAAAVANGKIYAIGGYGAAGNLATVEEYDPAVDSWTSRTDMPTAREEHAAATLNGMIYAVGGWSGIADLATNEEYDPVFDSWSTRASMITARSGLGAASIADSMYAVGGLFGFTYLDVNEMYYFNPVHITCPTFHARLSGFKVKLIWKVPAEHDCQCYVVVRKIVHEAVYKEKARIPGRGSSPSPHTYTYVDKDVSPGKSYCYKLGIIQLNGEIEWIGPCEVSIPYPKAELHIAPNPVHHRASIKVSIPFTCLVKVDIHDAAGKWLKCMHHGIWQHGTHTIYWDCSGANGAAVAAGIYFCTVSYGSSILTRKLLIMR